MGIQGGADMDWSRGRDPQNWADPLGVTGDSKEWLRTPKHHDRWPAAQGRTEAQNRGQGQTPHPHPKLAFLPAGTSLSLLTPVLDLPAAGY